MRVAGFDWDAGNRSKCRKHGVSTAEIESLFHSPIAVVPDPRHSKSEERFKAIGKTNRAPGFWSCSLCGHDAAKHSFGRFSARYMHIKEMDHYEKETATLPKR